MDWISQLPEPIVHHILSCFYTLHALPVELVRMSVLSKTWFHLTASFPVLDFTIDNFTNVSRQSFFKYVEYTTSRFSHQNVTAHKLKIITTLLKPAELDIVNRCLQLLLLKNGVRELVISFTNFLGAQKYRLPNILLSVSMLKSLTIRRCKLPSSLMVDVVRFKSLVQLTLEDVTMDDEVINYLTTSCPLLEELRIRRCRGFKRFCVHGHQNLQKVGIFYNTPVERLDIEAPNLSILSVIDYDGRGAPRMNLASCKKLTTVAYYGHPSPNSNGFTDFLSNFPFIENLALATKYKCNNLKFSSHSLRSLLLHTNCDFENIEFSTPNLVLFIYTGHVTRALLNYDIFWPPVTHSTARLEACMHCYDNCVEALWFQKLRLFLGKKNGFRVLNLHIEAIYSQKFKDLEKLKAIELPAYELEHVELQLEAHKESSAHVAFVDAVLWCCRPRSLTLRSSFPLTDYEEQSDVVKFTYEKLLQQEDEGHTKIQIVLPSSSKAQKHLMDLKSLSMALPRERNAISFIKEEGKVFIIRSMEV